MQYIIIAAALLLAVLGGSYWAFRMAFYSSPKRTREESVALGEQYDAVREELEVLRKRVEEAPCEWVNIRSQDGLVLSGRYCHIADGAPVDIIFHGYRGTVSRDCAGGFSLAGKAGHNVLLPDQRAHGKSGGRVISFGIKEQYDALAWARYAADRWKNTDIWLTGVSMGAATVLMASALELPQNVRGIIADCGYSSPREIIRKVIGEMKLPVWAAYPFARLGAWLWGGFRLESGSPEDSLKRAKVPVLILHGEDDRFVPCGMGRANYDACVSEKQLVTVPGAGHGLSCLIDPDTYKGAVAEFYEKTRRKI